MRLNNTFRNTTFLGTLNNTFRNTLITLSVTLGNFQLKSKSSHRKLVGKLEKKLRALYLGEMVDGTADHVRLDKLGFDLEDPELSSGWCRPVS